MTAFGASFPFPLALVQVGKLNGHRPFSQGGGNGSKCPKAAIRRSIEDRVCRVGKLPLVAPLQNRRSRPDAVIDPARAGNDRRRDYWDDCLAPWLLGHQRRNLLIPKIGGG